MQETLSEYYAKNWKAILMEKRNQKVPSDFQQDAEADPDKSMDSTERATSFFTGQKQILTLLCSLGCTNPSIHHCSTKINRTDISKTFL